MADRMALMDAGRVVQSGRPRDLYENPASRFVADFIGVSNFFEGTTAAGGLATEAHGLLRSAGEGAPGRPAAIMVRPERIVLAAEKPADRNGALGEIADIAYHGNDLNLHVAVAGSERAVIARVGAADETASRWRPGQKVWCCWRPEHGRLLTE